MIVSWELFSGTLKKYLSESDNDYLEQVYLFAKEAHSGQLRKSGEPFITHPLAVANQLAVWGQDRTTLAAGLLHDCIEDSNVTKEDVAVRFGEKVAELVEGVTKLGRFSFQSKEEEQAENFRKMIVAMAEDIRVIIIKLADRFHNMKTLKYLSEAKQYRIAQETLDIYVPIATRIGMASLKWELEDLAFFYLDYDAFQEIKKSVSAKRQEREGYIQAWIKTVKSLLKETQLSADVVGRPKHFYSIYRKLSKNNISFDELYDMLGIRILVSSVKECYEVLGLMHSNYKPVSGRFKDYIAVPKSNMYQSLHTTVVADEGRMVEVQIRTHQMQKVAEYGVASHWKYKEGSTGQKKGDEFSWVRELMDLQKESPNSRDFLENFKLDLYTEEVFVFTPKGDVRVLKKGANIIDFAYLIHTDVGNHCVGGKVNGRIVPLTHTLSNGDRVEILTSKSQLPHLDWLQHVATRQARVKIKQWFKKKHRDVLIKEGREKLEQTVIDQGYELGVILKQVPEKHLCDAFSMKSLEHVYLAIAQGDLFPKKIWKFLSKVSKIQDPDVEDRPIFQASGVKGRPHPRGEQGGVIVFGEKNLMYSLAKCCSPLPGDDIEGIVTIGKGVSIHRSDCTNLLALAESDSQRIVPSQWAIDGENQVYEATLEIEAFERMGVLEEIIGKVSQSKVNMLNLNSFLISDGSVMRAIIVLEIRDSQSLRHLIQCIESIPDILSVSRG